MDDFFYNMIHIPNSTIIRINIYSTNKALSR